MANLANGSTVFLASVLAAAKNVTAATNAAEAVLTSTGHGLKDGDFVVVTNGWNDTNGRVFKVGASAADNFKLVGCDTSDTVRFPAGAGVGSVQKITEWTQISQITNVEASGGEQQFTQYGFLEDDFERQLPSVKSARAITFTMAYEPDLPGYKAAAKASDSKAQTPLRINLPTGKTLLYNGYPSLNDTPALTRNEIMTVSLSYSLSVKFNQY